MALGPPVMDLGDKCLHMCVCKRGTEKRRWSGFGTEGGQGRPQWKPYDFEQTRGDTKTARAGLEGPLKEDWTVTTVTGTRNNRKEATFTKAFCEPSSVLSTYIINYEVYYLI